MDLLRLVWWARLQCFLLDGGVAVALVEESTSQGGVAGGVIRAVRGAARAGSVREGGERVPEPGDGGGAELELLREEAALSVLLVVLRPRRSLSGSGEELSGRARLCWSQESQWSSSLLVS